MKMLWVTLQVSDLEKSVAFYTNMLGLEVASRFGDEACRIVMLGEGGDAKVELICEGKSLPESPGAGISFGLETDDLDALTARLEQKGHTVTGPISPNPHIRFSFVSDLDGYTVQLVEQK